MGKTVQSMTHKIDAILDTFIKRSFHQLDDALMVSSSPPPPFEMVAAKGIKGEEEEGLECLRCFGMMLFLGRKSGDDNAATDGQLLLCLDWRRSLEIPKARDGGKDRTNVLVIAQSNNGEEKEEDAANNFIAVSACCCGCFVVVRTIASSEDRQAFLCSFRSGERPFLPSGFRSSE